MTLHLLRLAVAIVCCFLSSCGTHFSKKKSTASWVGSVDNEISSLGAYNWIIIAESSYPTSGRSGTRTLFSPERIPATLDQVLQSIDSSGHVKGRLYMAREVQQLTPDYAPGIEGFKKSLEKHLHGREIQHLPQRSLKILKESAERNFQILMVKTQTTLPYTSIYIELESGYWDSESETALRRQIKESN